MLGFFIGIIFKKIKINQLVDDLENNDKKLNVTAKYLQTEIKTFFFVVNSAIFFCKQISFTFKTFF